MKHPIKINKSYSVINQIAKDIKADRIVILVDENTKKYCLPRFLKKSKIKGSIIEIQSGEENKDIDTLQSIWEQMIREGMSRKSLLINLGGGVIGDMGGFAASTYMRGMAFIQVPTTLLSMVDASVGGKLGIDFGQMKNMIGVFNAPHLVWIDTKYLITLPEDQLQSGMGEVIKHSLIADKELWKLLLKQTEITDWDTLVKRNVAIKKAVVKADPKEKGLRKILNYGHTVGHAIESHYLLSDTPLLHGQAIIMGMLIENIISKDRGLLSPKQCNKINTFLASQVKAISLKASQSDLEAMLLTMANDKKNSNGKLKFSLLKSPGSCTYDVTVSPSEVLRALNESQLFSV